MWTCVRLISWLFIVIFAVVAIPLLGMMSLSAEERGDFCGSDSEQVGYLGWGLMWSHCRAPSPPPVTLLQCHPRKSRLPPGSFPGVEGLGEPRS